MTEESRPPAGDGPRQILFVCSGNTCRSPMAAVLFRRLALAAGLDHLEIRSAGTAAVAGSPLSPGARRALAKRGIKADDHQAGSLDQELLAWADVVLTMTRGHKAEILRRFPQAAGRVHVLAAWAEPERWQDLVREGEDLYREIGRVQDQARERQQEEIRALAARREELRGSGGEARELEAIEKRLLDLEAGIRESVKEQRDSLTRVESSLAALDVEDPLMGGPDAYEVVADRLEGLLRRVVGRLAAPPAEPAEGGGAGENRHGQ